jgi:hypothetical protein
MRWNMYAYALNNPLSMTDPTGKDAAAVNFGGMVAGLGHEGIVSINPDGSAEYARFGPTVQDAVGLWGGKRTWVGDHVSASNHPIWSEWSTDRRFHVSAKGCVGEDREGRSKDGSDQLFQDNASGNGEPERLDC